MAQAFLLLLQMKVMIDDSMMGQCGRGRICKLDCQMHDYTEHDTTVVLP